MIRKILLKITSAVIGAIIFVVLYLTYVIQFNSIIISHYGGIDVNYQFIIGITLTIAISFFSSQIQSISSVKPFLKRLFLQIVIASFISLLYIFLIGLINDYSSIGKLNPKIIVEIARNPFYYCLIIGVLIQILILSKLTKSENKALNYNVLIVQTVALPLIATTLFALLYIQSLTTAYSKIPEAQIVLIPTNLESDHVRIFYGEEGGIEVPIENDSLLFEIPKNGILIVQNEMSKNKPRRSYYVQLNHGIREEINSSSYQIVHGYNTRDGGYNHNFPVENGIQLPEEIQYENLYFDLDFVNEELLFEKYLESKKIDQHDYFFKKSDWLEKYRHLERIRFDSLTVLLINKSREGAKKYNN